MSFECKKCGKCCRNVDLTVPEFDRGDGVCFRFDEKTNLCSIYKDRPLICRVDDLFEEVMKFYLKREDYYGYINFMCENFKKEI